MKGPKTINASKFKEQCLSLLDSLDQEGIVITKHGKAVARLVPIQRMSGGLIGSYRGELGINGSILSTGTKWDTLS